MEVYGMVVIEPSRKLEISNSYEVVVIGGGIAGISAGIAAARAGKKVCLIEREYMLGGLATLGLVTIYLPLCDGDGNQMISGIGEELLKRSVSFGSGKIPECWTATGDQMERKEKRYRTQFDPASFAYALDLYIHELDIDIMFGTLFSNVIMQEDEIRYLILENKEGRFALQADMVIDATGDADVCYLAGENTEMYTENRKAGWYYSVSERDGYQLNILQEDIYKPIEPNSKGYSGIYCHEISEFVLESRKMIFEHSESQNDGSAVAQIASIPQQRMTRRLKGKTELDETDERVYFQDSIGMFGDWRICGRVYYLPFSALYGSCRNLLAAGRCISVTTAAWDITRAIPVCALSGEAAGVAASLKIEHHLSRIQDLPAELLRNAMIEKGNLINESI